MLLMRQKLSLKISILYKKLKNIVRKYRVFRELFDWERVEIVLLHNKISDLLYGFELAQHLVLILFYIKSGKRKELKCRLGRLVKTVVYHKYFKSVNTEFLYRKYLYIYDYFWCYCKNCQCIKSVLIKIVILNNR